jgi:hypothetical protein
MAKQEKSPPAKLPAGLKAAFAVLAMGAAALFGGCENETNSTPVPIVYNVSLGTKQIRVEDTTGQASQADIQSALDLIDSSLSGNNGVIYFKAMNTSPVMVIENTHNVRVEGNKFFIGMDAINTDINNTIYVAIQYIYNANDPRMAKLSDREIINLGRQFG